MAFLPRPAARRGAAPLLLGLLMPLLLAGCGAVTPQGLLAAARLDPLGSDPAALTAALGVPATLRLADGDAELTFAFAADAAGGPAADGTFALVLAPATTDDGLPRPDAGERLWTARLAPGDAARLRALQAEVRALRAAGVRGSGSLTVGLVGGCFEGARPDTLPVRTFLSTDPDGGFVALTRTTDLLAELPTEARAALAAGIGPCPGGGATGS
jgi:hypothetical protein